MSVFKVLTEFRFDVIHAVASSEQLQSAVGEISNAADNALMSFQRLGAGIVTQMGLGAGGLLGFLYEAINASEKFGATQRKIAGIFAANQDKIAGGPRTFLELMQASEHVMENIGSMARDLGLSGSALANTTVQVGAALMPHGLAGNNMSNAVEIGRRGLKAAQILGVPGESIVQPLTDLAIGRGQMNDQFTQRLVSDAAVFQQYNRGGQKGRSPLAAFNALPADERIKKLIEALKQFSSNASIVEANAKSLTQQMQVLKDSFSGAYSVIKPIGEVFATAGAKLLASINKYIGAHGTELAKNIASLIQSVFEDPKKLFVNLLQARELKKDVTSAGQLAGIYGGFLFIKEIMQWMGIKVPSVFGAFRTGMSFIFTQLGKFISVFSRFLIFVTGATNIFGAIYTVLNGVFMVAVEILKPFALLLGIFQLISRAWAIAKVNDAIAIAELMPRFVKAIADLKTAFFTLLDPFIKLFDATANFISPLFQLAHWMELLVWIVEGATTILITFQAGFQGLMFVIFESYTQLKSLMTGGGFSFAKIGDAFTAGIDDAIERNMTAINNGTGSLQNNITNIAKVEIRNEFKEQLEPDRIAFTLKEQLLKAATNRGQANGRSLQGNFATVGR